MRKLAFAIAILLLPAIAQAQQEDTTGEQACCAAAQAISTQQACQCSTKASAPACESGTCCAEANQVVMYSFTADWCSPCQEMKKTFTDEDVAKVLSSHCKVVQVDIDDDQATTKKFGITSIPTQVFVTADGNVIKKVTGLQDKETFIATVKEVAPTQTSPYYAGDVIQYYAPGPEFKLSKEAAALHATAVQIHPHITVRKVVEGQNQAMAIRATGNNVVTVVIGDKPYRIKANKIEIQEKDGVIRLQCEGTKVEATVEENASNFAHQTDAISVTRSQSSPQLKIRLKNVPAVEMTKAVGDILRLHENHVACETREWNVSVVPEAVSNTLTVTAAQDHIQDVQEIVKILDRCAPECPISVGASCEKAVHDPHCTATVTNCGVCAAQETNVFVPATTCQNCQVATGTITTSSKCCASECADCTTIADCTDCGHCPFAAVTQTVEAAQCPASQCPASQCTECPAGSSCADCEGCPFATAVNACPVLSHLQNAAVGFWHPQPGTVHPPHADFIKVGPTSIRPHIIKPSEEVPAAGAYCVVTTTGQRHSYAGEFIRMTDDFIIVKENGTTHWIPRSNVECLSVTEEKLASRPEYPVSAFPARVYPNPVTLPYPGAPLRHAHPAQMMPPQQAAPVPPAKVHAIPAKGMFHIDLTLKNGDKVLSRPHLMTLEHQRACIEVGQSNGPSFFAGVEVHRVPGAEKGENTVCLEFFNKPKASGACSQVVCKQGSTVSVPWQVEDQTCVLEVAVREHSGDQSCCQASKAAKPVAANGQLETRVYKIITQEKQAVPLLAELPHVGALFSKKQSVNTEEFCEAIKACCAGTWEEDGGHGQLVVFEQNGSIVVCQTRDAHEKIAAAIQKLHAKIDGQPQNRAVRTSFEFDLKKK